MISENIVKNIKEVVKGPFVLESLEDRLCYSYDATRQEFLPDLVIRPDNAQEISEVLKIANANYIPVYIRGAATGLTGGCVPVNSGIVISLTRMNRIIEIDEKNLIAVVEPGVITALLHKAVEEKGLFYPPDPASFRVCTIGGNIAENAGGLRALKYGVTRDYCLGLEAVLPTGGILNTGARTLKCVAGFDLTSLLIGSEGLLAVITKIILKLIPLPEKKITIASYYHTVDEAAETVSQIISNKIVPVSLELMDSDTIDCVGKYLNNDFPQDTEAMLLIELDGKEDIIEKEIRLVQKICEKNGAFFCKAAGEEKERTKLWEVRTSISPALYRIAPKKLNEDICVPRSQIPEMLRRIKNIAKKYNLIIPCFGHAGDGNIHVNIMLDPEKNNMDDAEKAVLEVFKNTLELAGTISGEHGIGNTKMNYLEMEVGPDFIRIMKDIKKIFDPRGILNQGKMFE
ncbi:MAG: FAD-binding protein [Candidatus Firestonebacteria bacterium]|nr:FAD-binding protein [Candidatus Firestonebacteria bacterium]